jgi:hypothetical protein
MALSFQLRVQLTQFLSSGICGNHANSFIAPSCDDKQHATFIRFAQLYGALLPIPEIHRYVDRVVIYDLFRFSRGYPVLSDMIAIVLVPMKRESHCVASKRAAQRLLAFQ